MSVEAKYLSHSDVVSISVDNESPRNPYSTGYGAKIPTRYKLSLKNKRTYRVYVMNYSNSGSPYILQKGEVFFLDSDIEHALRDALDLYITGDK